MNAPVGTNGSRPAATVERLREQIAQDRRALVETVSALHGKTDVKQRVRKKAADAEIAAADMVGSAAGLLRRQFRVIVAAVSAIAAAAAGMMLWARRRR